jgi:hypothetical protein
MGPPEPLPSPSVNRRTRDQSKHAQELYPRYLQIGVAFPDVRQRLFQAQRRNPYRRLLALLAGSHKLKQIGLTYAAAAGPESTALNHPAQAPSLFILDISNPSESPEIGCYHIQFWKSREITQQPEVTDATWSTAPLSALDRMAPHAIMNTPTGRGPAPSN